MSSFIYRKGYFIMKQQFDNTRHKSDILAMLKKVHDYKDGQYVLWLDFNLFSQYLIHKMDAKIEALDESGNVIQVLADTKADENSTRGSLIRKPYPNYYISQIGFKNGRKRIYGVPVIYSSFKEIERIKMIRVIWTAYRSHFLDEKAFDMYVEELIVLYDVKFTQESGKYWYTIGSQDEFESDWQERIEESIRNKDGYEKSYTSYDTEYDYKLGYAGSVILSDKKGNDDFDDVGVIKKWGRIINKELSNDILNGAFRKIECMPLNEDRVRDMLEKINPVRKSEVNYYRALYETHAEIKAKDCADMLISSAFGF